jgi:hypothetical protein
MGERHEDLARPDARQPHVILYDCIAKETVLDPQPFENPLRRMPLLGRRRLAADDDDTKPFGIEAFRY